MPDLVEGQVQYVQGSGKKPYELQLKGGVYSCSCPAWRNQSAPIDKRTCKHLKLVRGDAAEQVRTSGFHAVGVTSGRTQTAAPNQAKPPRSVVEADFAELELRALAQSPANPGLKTAAVEILEKMKTERPEEYAKLSAWVDALPEPKTSPGCACERGSTCDVSHDPATCPCIRCTTAGSKHAVLARAEKTAGRKLRPDEKTKLFGPPVLLAHPFEDADVDPTGWWMSEKLDGVRAYWDGKDFVSRQGNVFHAPDWFKEGLPSHPLDGELWMDRRSFQQTISIVKSIDAGPRWKAVQYLVFDMPHLKIPFEARQDALEEVCLASKSKILKIVQQTPCKDPAHLKTELDQLVKMGAEGLMIRKPGSSYEAGRSWSILKVKPWKDAEAAVVGYEAGKGRHKGRTGGLVVKTDAGIEFNIGTGLSDEDRRNPPKVGARITFRYMDVTDAGVPKGASYVCTRDYE